MDRRRGGPSSSPPVFLPPRSRRLLLLLSAPRFQGEGAHLPGDGVLQAMLRASVSAAGHRESCWVLTQVPRQHYTEVQATPWPPPICPSSKNPLLVRCPWRVLSDPTSEASRLKRKPGVATGAGQPDLPCQSEMARGSRCSSPWEERPEGGCGAAGSGRASGPAGIRDPLGTGQLGAARPGLPERGGFSAGNKGVAAASGPIAEDTIECLGARHCSKRCA